MLTALFDIRGCVREVKNRQWFCGYDSAARMVEETRSAQAQESSACSEEWACAKERLTSEGYEAPPENPVE